MVLTGKFGQSGGLGSAACGVRHWVIRAALVSLSAIALAAGLSACSRNPAFVAPPPPPVTVSNPLAAPIQDAADFTGQASASRTVDLVARVPGFLKEVRFADGADVEKGQLLFQIEPDQYQVQVALSRATLDEQQATLKSAELDFDRKSTLQRQLAASQADYDKALSTRDSARAAVAQAQANLKIAELNLSYTKIEAPFSGRIGRRLVDAGNLVGQGSPTKLATLSQVDTIYVYFNINERDLLRVRQDLNERGIDRESVLKLPVYVGLADEKGTPHQGRLDFVDTGVDPSTGTLQARAVFDNAKNILIPGLFARLRIPVGAPKQSLLVPETAISIDQVGPYVLLVDAGGAVVLRRITLGATQNGLRVAAEGLAATDRVIIDGLQNATPGRKVTVQEGRIAETPAASNP
jgi:RND family efflux transporter MFP subunit